MFTLISRLRRRDDAASLADLRTETMARLADEPATTATSAILDEHLLAVTA